MSKSNKGTVYYGRITRGGSFLYPEGWKEKDYNNLKEEYKKYDFLPAFGSKVYDSHNEEKSTTQLIGFGTDWEFDDKNEDVYGKVYFFDDMKDLSDLKNPIELPISAKFDDAGQGNQQVITRLHHLAISLNKLEDDRCGLEHSKACTISPVGDFTITGGSSDSYDFHTVTADSVNYWKLNTNISNEAIDMGKKETDKDSGKSTPSQNPVGEEIEKCAAGEKTEEECKMEQKRKERTGKWDGEVSGKVSKDLEDLDITLEDLTALIEENEDLKAEIDGYKKTSSDLESKVDDLIKWQKEAFETEKVRKTEELDVIKKDLVDNHKICDTFIENHDNYDFLTEFHKGLPEPEADLADKDEDEDKVIPTSLTDMGVALKDVKEQFDYLDMRK